MKSFNVGQNVPTEQIRNALGRKNWVIEEIESFEGKLPNLFNRMIEQGFDGAQYILVSQPTGRQRKQSRIVCWYGVNSKQFSSVF
ncbi:hypothetical protein [Aeromonas veronii]|uniref:hypothetical protein n=1 Tax=Aeromonas veronii TaxID=654 RepID=UPI003D216F0C